MTSRGGTVPPLLLLAGTSEAGKSTAGQHLVRRGAKRIKIRNILLSLSSGVPVSHEGVATREGFDHGEFVSQLRIWVTATTEPLVVVESFIDARLAELTRSTWPTVCEVVFIDAPPGLRIVRYASATGLGEAQSERNVRAKDGRKLVVEQFTQWQRIANHWVENSGSIAMFKNTLDQIMTSTLARAGTRSNT